MIAIDVLNRTTVLTDDALRAMVAAIQQQVTDHWAATWDTPALLNFIPRGAKAQRTSWWMVVSDTADTAGALGYHDVTPTGKPLGKVFAKTTLDAGDLPSVTLSHEVLEMLGDPYTALAAQGDGAVFYAYEVCDPVEDDVYGYKIGGVTVSDFVLPAYFDPRKHGKHARFDFMGRLTAPLQLLPGGYQLIWTPAHGWTQKEDPSSAKTGRQRSEAEAYKARGQVGSRRERRRTFRHLWAASTADG